MQNVLRRLATVAVLAMLLAIAAGGTVRAADAPALASLRIMVWPEYDDPRVLVIYQGEFADKTGFPREVSFFVPADADILATAYYPETGDGNPMNTDAWTTETVTGGFARVTFKLPTSRFHMEFYYNPLPASSEKAFEYVYRAAQATAKVRLEIQQPLKAENFATDPPAASTASGNHGFKNHLFDFPAVAADQTVRVKVLYTKTDPKPSVDNVASSLPASANAPAGANQANDPTAMLPYVIGAVALALAALAFFAWQNQRQSFVRAPARAAARRKARRGAAEAAVYCTQCGNALDEDDNFCSVCGAKRRD